MPSNLDFLSLRDHPRSMLRVIGFVCLICFTPRLNAQSNLDSLLNLLSLKQTANDKIAIYAKICWSYLSLGNIDLAGHYADSVNQMAIELKDTAGIYKAQYYYGIIARFRGEYSTSLKYFDKYLNYYRSKGDSSRVAGVLYQIGVVHSRYGNYEKSLAAYQRSLDIEEAAQNFYSVGYTLNVIGIIHFETMDYDNAIANFRKALSIFDSLNAQIDKTDVLVNLGNTYSEKDDFYNAMKYYQQALAIDKTTGKEQGIANSLANIAFLFDKMKQYDSALAYHHKALAIREQLSDFEKLSRSLIGVGRGYVQLQQYDPAFHYLSQALQVSQQSNSKPLIRDAHLNLSNMYESKREFEKSLQHLKQYHIYKDSIFNDESAEKLNELEIKHEVADKVRHIALLEKEKQIQQSETKRQATINKIFLTGLILMSALAAVVVYAFRQRVLIMKKDREIEEANLRSQLSELKIKALRAQINPHFMFNCLNSINRMIVKGDNENASIYLKKFSKLVRLIVENGEANRVSLENELTLIESYIQLEELRFKSKIGYEINIDGSIEKESTFLPPMVLQPFVENSIWHGLMNKNADEPGKIRISVKENKDVLLCLIEDNGVGREKSGELKALLPGKTKSVGIKITEERLQLLSRDRLRDLVKIVDLKDTFNAAIGTRVEIRIPLS